MAAAEAAGDYCDARCVQVRIPISPGVHIEGGAATPGFGSGRLTRGPRGDGHVFPLLQGLRPGLRCGHGRSDASGAPAEASAAGWGVPDGGAAEAPDRELAEADGPMVMLLGTTGPGSVSAVR